LAIDDVHAIFAGGGGGFEEEFNGIALAEDSFGGGDAEVVAVGERIRFEVLAGAAIESFGFESNEKAASVLGQGGKDGKLYFGDAVFVGVDFGFGEDTGRIRGSGLILRIAGVELDGNVGGGGDAVGSIGGDVESGGERSGDVLARNDEIEMDGVAGDANIEMAFLGAVGRGIGKVGGEAEILEALVVIVEQIGVVVGEIESGVEFVFGVEIAFLGDSLVDVPFLFAVVPGGVGLANDGHVAA